MGLGYGFMQLPVDIRGLLKILGFSEDRGHGPQYGRFISGGAPGVFQGGERPVQKTGPLEVNAQLKPGPALEFRVQGGAGDYILPDMQGPLYISPGTIQITQSKVYLHRIRIVSDHPAQIAYGGLGILGGKTLTSGDIPKQGPGVLLKGYFVFQSAKPCHSGNRFEH
jgi:hypothetical protein